MKELKATIFKSRFHVTRFIGLLIMPFLYAFTFTYAFFDPFGHTDKIPMKVVTDKFDIDNKKKLNAEDYANKRFIYELGEEMTKPGTKITTGGMKLNLQLEHIYVEPSKNADPKIAKAELEDRLLKIAKDGYTTFYIPQMTHSNPLTAKFTTRLSKFIASMAASVVNNKKVDVITELTSIIQDYKIGSTKVFANYKKNYLLGFSSDISGSFNGKHGLIISKLVDALIRMNHGVVHHDQNYDWFKTMISANLAANPPTGNTAKEAAIIKMATDAENTLKDVKDSGIFDLHAMRITSQMGNLGPNGHPTYGYGLGLFFIAVGMWIGTIVMTFAVHTKVHDKTVHPTKRYLIKYSIIAIGVFIQTTILMGTLYFVGYDQLGLTNFFSMYVGVLFSSLVFAVVVQAIRFIIPNRVFGIFVTIILLVLQIAASGGLFPYETQSIFYRGLHHILPMTYAINISREMMFQTDWGVVFTNVGYLLIFVVAMPLGIAIKNKQDRAYYKKVGWDMPSKTGGKNV